MKKAHTHRRHDPPPRVDEHSCASRPCPASASADTRQTASPGGPGWWGSSHGTLAG